MKLRTGSFALPWLALLGHANAADLPTSIQANDGAYEIKIIGSPRIAVGEANEFKILVVCPQGCGDANVEVSAAMPGHDHGLLYTPSISKCGDAGMWCVKELRFHMPGLWEIYFDVSTQGGRSVDRAQTSVDL
jgi:hypothetical protein